jgi:hypothetical protein
MPGLLPIRVADPTFELHFLLLAIWLFTDGTDEPE